MRKERGTRCDGGKTGWEWEDGQFPAGGEDGAGWHSVAGGVYVASLHYSRPNAGIGLLRTTGNPGEEIQSSGCRWGARLPGDPAAGALPRNPAVPSGDAGGGLRGGRQGPESPSARGENEGCFPTGLPTSPGSGAPPGPGLPLCSGAPRVKRGGGGWGSAGAGSGPGPGPGSGPGPGPGGRRSRAAAAPSAGAALTRQLVVGAVQVAGVGQALLPAFAPHLLRGGGGGEPRRGARAPPPGRGGPRPPPPPARRGCGKGAAVPELGSALLSGARRRCYRRRRRRRGWARPPPPSRPSPPPLP